MSDILFIDADYDLATQYCKAFRNRFLFTPFSQNWPKHTPHYVQNQHAIKQTVEQYLTGHPIRYVSGAGHGLYDTFTGYNNQMIWHANDNLGLLKGMIVHLLSCQAGALLGRKIVEQGAVAFWGYTVDFQFWRSDQPPADLSQDASAEVCLKMDCFIDRGVLSRRRAKHLYQSINNYVTQLVSNARLKPHHRAMLLDNFVHLVCPGITWGDTYVII